MVATDIARAALVATVPIAYAAGLLTLWHLYAVAFGIGALAVLRSRVSGAYTFANYGLRVLGALAGGFLGAAIGLRPTLWIATAGALAGVCFLLPSPVLRPRELPEPADARAEARRLLAEARTCLFGACRGSDPGHGPSRHVRRTETGVVPT